MKKKFSKPDGFTLIELLVVIAIITILVSILLPTLYTVRQKAIMTSCLANLKQIGQAVHMYLNDYNEYWYPSLRGFTGYTPPLWGPAERGHHWSSVGFLDTLSKLKYINGEIKTTNRAPSTCPDGTPDWVIWTSTGVLKCPCMDESMRWSKAWGYGVSMIDYGYNAKLPIYAKKLSKVRRPDQTVLFAESVVGEMFFYTWVPETFAVYQQGAVYDGSKDRHTRIKLINTLYVDGHVKAMPWNEFMRDSVNNP
jgi:prepilin-type N-terminal cleavage/methylation domain-containing protein/prepilin-type processing-associated H-X9-DG protein